MTALKDDNGGGRLAGGGAGGDTADGNKGDAGDNSVPPIAQLKMLRKLQEDVNRRTEAFAKEHPDTKNIDDRTKAELDGIVNDQKDVAELLESLQSTGEPDAAEEGKKP